MKVQFLAFTCILVIVTCAQIQSMGQRQASGLDIGSNSYRAIVTRENIQFIQQHNQNKDSTYRLKPYSQFISLTPNQVRSLYLMEPIQPQSLSKSYSGVKVSAPTDLMKLKATYVDLTISFATPVQNQGKCGNCYAFATTDVVDILNKVGGKQKQAVSPQHLTDCSKNYYVNNGCNGGSIYVSFQYMKTSGLYTTEVYPLSNQTVISKIQQPCKTVEGATKHLIKGWKYFPKSGCEQRIYQLTKGNPISIGITGGSPYFYLYSSGVLTDCFDYRKIDHAVVLVGASYDPNNLKESFLKVKNSWGAWWGEKGYIRISLSNTTCMGCTYGAYPSL